MNKTTNNTFTFYEIYDADILRDRYGFNSQYDFEIQPCECIDTLFNIEYSFNAKKICDVFNHFLKTEIKTYCEPLNNTQIFHACIKNIFLNDYFVSTETLFSLISNEINENLIAVPNTGTEPIKFIMISKTKEHVTIVNFLENLLKTEFIETKRKLSYDKERYAEGHENCEQIAKRYAEQKNNNK